MDEQELEKLIAVVYARWKETRNKGSSAHPDEETLALFSENKLSASESARVKEHLLFCERCAESIAIRLRKTDERRDVSPELTEKVKQSIAREIERRSLEIVLKLKDKALELLHTTGDVLLGKEFVPAAAVRGDAFKNSKDSVLISKDFEAVCVQIKIEHKENAGFTAAVSIKEKRIRENAVRSRVTLLKEGVEMESRVSDSGETCFENMQPGVYSIEVFLDVEIAAVISLDINA